MKCLEMASFWKSCSQGKYIKEMRKGGSRKDNEEKANERKAINVK
jgi:hypothetical protein